MIGAPWCLKAFETPPPPAPPQPYRFWVVLTVFSDGHHTDTGGGDGQDLVSVVDDHVEVK